ncbi:AAA family ATPase [Lactobacillus sp. ESL0701]|uniref:guanylate kinase n=1 Tax=Lactobacillus sp. ESL0701 TaxID=2983217 RepID=UPI0023F66EA3|nr:AAA family ATPase [Lactobacillus sp. ESL0701]MDF7671912.1 AAA family ATPase [Lactobacillus sp. ESL0701]
MRKLILIAGPSGAGKTTISEYLTKEFGIPRVVTHTTRPKRPGEKQHQAYHFEDDTSFSKLHFFEHVRYGSYQYGSSKEALDFAWQKNNLVSLIVDIQGAESYLKQLKQQVYFLYVTTSSKQELEKRLFARGDDPVKIQERMSGDELNQLPDELASSAHVLVNDDWSTTKKLLKEIITSL